MKKIIVLLVVVMICGTAWGENRSYELNLDYDRDRKGFVNEYELMTIISDSDFACGLPNCKIRKEHLFEKGTLTKKEIKLLQEKGYKDNWHFKFDKDISKCRGCRLIMVVCSGIDYYKSVPRGITKDGVMSMWFFDFEDNYLLKRIWELKSRLTELENLTKEKEDEKEMVGWDFEGNRYWSDGSSDKFPNARPPLRKDD